MSAAEIIEMIKKLPPEGQAEVRAFVQTTASEQNAVKIASDMEFERAANRVFSENKELLRRLAQ
jgi:hypothetical protein